jgi:biotin carboxyl carrier protein
VRINSETVGSVSQMHADTGSQVKAGESIGEIECMKTLFPIIVPCDGKLRWLVEVGAFVGQGEAIAEIEGTT